MSLHGFYPGSFDPVTNGHLDIIKRAAGLFDNLTIGIGVHPTKQYVFSSQERKSMIESLCQNVKTVSGNQIQIMEYDTLTVDAANACRANAIIRGLRDAADFDYEMQLAGMNSQMDTTLETVFLAASPEVRHITANLVRQIAKMGGDTSPFVSKNIAQALEKKFLA